MSREHEDMDLVQLVSFGCGIDAITTDEVRAILESRGKLYTQIKIDEINNLGVVKIRLRSMLAAVEEQKRRNHEDRETAFAGRGAPHVADFRDDYPKFTPAMKHTHKILVPDMLPVHFGIIVDFLRKDGWDIELLRNDSRAVIDEGLKHVHNDTCFPALCVTGQFIDALKSGKYDVEHTAVMITQSGGGCRASNYIPLIRKALKSEFPHVPVISLNFAGLEKDSGFPVDLKTLLKLAYRHFLRRHADVPVQPVQAVRAEPGAADAAREECVRLINRAFDEGKYLQYKQITRGLLERFARVPRAARGRR